MTNILDKMHKMMDIFPTMSKEEADFIEEIIKWDSETKAAFLLAKRTFESDNNLGALTGTCKGHKNLKKATPGLQGDVGMKLNQNC